MEGCLHSGSEAVEWLHAVTPASEVGLQGYRDRHVHVHSTQTHVYRG